MSRGLTVFGGFGHQPSTDSGADKTALLAYTDSQDSLRVLKAGDSMSGPLDLAENRITGLADPVAPTDACTAAFALDSDASLKAGVISRDGTPSATMQVDLDLGGNRLVNVSDPIADSDAATKAYVDSAEPLHWLFFEVGGSGVGRVVLSANVSLTTGSPDTWHDISAPLGGFALTLEDVRPGERIIVTASMGVDYAAYNDIGDRCRIQLVRTATASDLISNHLIHTCAGGDNRLEKASSSWTDYITIPGSVGDPSLGPATLTLSVKPSRDGLTRTAIGGECSLMYRRLRPLSMGSIVSP